MGDGKLLAYLAAHGEVLSTKYTETTVLAHVRMPQKYLGRIESQVTVRDHHEPESPTDDAGVDERPTGESDDSRPMDDVA